MARATDSCALPRRCERADQPEGSWHRQAQVPRDPAPVRTVHPPGHRPAAARAVGGHRLPRRHRGVPGLEPSGRRGPRGRAGPRPGRRCRQAAARPGQAGRPPSGRHHPLARRLRRCDGRGHGGDGHHPEPDERLALAPASTSSWSSAWTGAPTRRRRPPPWTSRSSVTSTPTGWRSSARASPRTTPTTRAQPPAPTRWPMAPTSTRAPSRRRPLPPSGWARRWESTRRGHWAQSPAAARSTTPPRPT